MHVLSIVVEIGAVYVALLFAPLLFALSHSTTMSKQSHKNTANESSIESSNIMQLTQLTQLGHLIYNDKFLSKQYRCRFGGRKIELVIKSIHALVNSSFLINLITSQQGLFGIFSHGPLFWQGNCHLKGAI